MTAALDELGVNTEGALTPVSNVVCIMKSGAEIRIATPLSPEDVMSLWNTRKRIMKIPAGDRSYAVIKKRDVDFLHTFIPTK